MRLIDAEELMKHIRFVYHPIDDDNYTLLKDIIDSAPTIVGQKKGKWIRNSNETCSCSLCQSWIPNEQRYYANFCLFCGADMREEKDNNMQ